MSESKAIVDMSRAVAAKWLSDFAKSEYRFQIYGFPNSAEVRRVASILRSWRDGKTKFASILPVSDLGIRESGDSLELWSKDYHGIAKLAKWADSRGYETTFLG